MPNTRFDTGISLAKFNLDTAAVSKGSSSPALVKGSFSTPTCSMSGSKAPLNLVLATVPGEGIHLYETSQYQHLNSWLLPNDVTISGPAKLSIVCTETSPITSSKKAQNKRITSLVGSGSESGVESELSSTIDTQNFHLLDDGYFLYALIANKGTCKSAWVWTVNGKKNEIKFEEPVLNLQPLESNSPSGCACAVIFKSGKICVYSADLTEKLATSKEYSSVFWTEIVQSKDMPYLDSTLLVNFQHCALLASLEKNKLTIRALGVLPENGEITEVGVPVTLDSMDGLKDPSISFWTQTGALFILSKEYVLYRICLSFSEKKSEITQLNLRKLSAGVASITALSSDHVALLGTEKVEEGTCHKLFLWDTKLSVLLHQQNVGEVIPKSKSQSITHLDRTRNQLMVSLLNTANEAKIEILLFPYHCPAESSLLDSLNKMSATIPFLASKEGSKFLDPPSALPLNVSDGSLNEIMGLQELDVQMFKELQATADTEFMFLTHLSILQDAQTATATKSVQVPESDFLSVLKSRVSKEDSTSEVWPTLYQAEHYQDSVSSKLVGSISLLSPRYISILVGKLASNYSSKVVTGLLVSSRFSSSMFQQTDGGLIPWLIQHEDWANIQLALQVISDISEEELVGLLKTLYARLPNKEAHGCFDALLGLVLDYSFDRQLILFSLAHLSGEEVSFYLKTLSRLLEDFSSPQTLLTEPASHFDKIYRLLSSIIDVHFTFIASSENLHSLLLHLRKFTRTRMEALQAFVKVEPMLDSFRKSKRGITTEDIRTKRPRHSATINLPYSIEIFDLF